MSIPPDTDAVDLKWANFEEAWKKRPWVEEATDKERALRWWNAGSAAANLLRAPAVDAEAHEAWKKIEADRLEHLASTAERCAAALDPNSNEEVGKVWSRLHYIASTLRMISDDLPPAPARGEEHHLSSAEQDVFQNALESSVKDVDQSPSSPSAEYVLVPREPSREVCAHIPALIALGPDDLPPRKLGWTMNEISNLKRWRMFLDALGCNQTSPALTAAPQVEELLDPKTRTYVKAVRVSPTQPAETKGDVMGAACNAANRIIAECGRGLK